MVRLLPFVLTLMICILGLLGPRHTAAHSAEQIQNYNILLITVDCLRPDHMGIYGYSRPTTPNIDKFFSNSPRFSQVISQASWTSPSIISIFTGLYPAVHGMDAKGKYFDKYNWTPIKQLQQNGYITLGYDTQQNYGNQGWTDGLKKGALIQTLQKYRDKKFFAWYHYREPHLPYNAPRPFKGSFFKDPSVLSKTVLELLSGNEKLTREKITLKEKDKEPVTDLYDEDVLYQDSLLAPVFEYLKSSGLEKKTIVVLTADHGEELMEHGFIGHASTSMKATVYDEVIRVPLLIKIPGIQQKIDIKDQVQQVDIMPTLFEILGRTPSGHVQGESLLPLVFGEKERQNKFAFVETSFCGWQCPEDEKKNRLYAVRTGNWKLVQRRIDGIVQHHLYNLYADPGEKFDRINNNRLHARQLHQILTRYQNENLGKAFELASSTAKRHIEESKRFLKEKNGESAKAELDELFHLNNVYLMESPTFIDHPDYGGPWQVLLAQGQELYKLLKVP